MNPTTDPCAEILQRAAQRGRELNLPYGGAVTPAEAWTLFSSGAAKLVDVRTEAETTFVGRIPDAAHVEWRAFKATAPHPDFLESLRAHVAPGETVMFLCRSGVRSHAAAQLAAGAGWPQALNILEGFEGDLDPGSQQRGAIGGWRKAGLPWIQS